jgi:orotate phosphoribosyltransferase
VVTVVDRLEGAEGNLAAEGLKLEALLTATDFSL